MKIVIPPIAEQRAIAEVLGAVEEAIAKTEALIEAIAAAKHATMREILNTGRSARQCAAEAPSGSLGSGTHCRGRQPISRAIGEL